MRVSVDLTRCQGYANCLLEAPGIFDLDDDSGLAVVLVPEPGPEAHDAARRAERMCPVTAIVVDDAAG
jgi:ferredoxin